MRHKGGTLQTPTRTQKPRPQASQKAEALKLNIQDTRAIKPKVLEPTTQSPDGKTFKPNLVKAARGFE